MAEGVAAGGRVIAEPTFDDPKAEPPEDLQAAPLGWTWNRGERRWKPKKSTGRGGYARTPGQGRAAQASSSPPKPPPDEATDGAGAGLRDPEPSWFREPGEDNRGREDGRQLSFDDVSQAVRDDIAGFAGLIGAPVLGLLQAADPYCGTALAQAYEPIVDAVLPLLCRSEKIVSYFAGDKSDWLLWGKLAMALAPVARAIYEHHIAHTVTVIRDERGQVQILRGRRDDADHLTPPAQPEFNYAA